MRFVDSFRFLGLLNGLNGTIYRVLLSGQWPEVIMYVIYKITHILTKFSYLLPNGTKEGTILFRLVEE